MGALTLAEFAHRGQDWEAGAGAGVSGADRRRNVVDIATAVAVIATAAVVITQKLRGA